jgi:hypothetical protein
MRVIANLFPEHIQVLPRAPAASADRAAQGEKVNYGRPPGTLVARLFEVYGLKEGRPAAGIPTCSPPPTASATASSTRLPDRRRPRRPGRTLSTVGMTQAAGRRCDARQGPEGDPFWSETTIRLAYKGIDMRSRRSPSALGGTNKQPEDLVYKITEALWNKNTRELLTTAKGKSIVRATP